MLKTCLCVVFVAAILSAASATSAETKSGEQIYAAVANAVFLVELHDSSGNTLAVGTAFLAAPQRLITNAHVVAGGTPFLRVGPVLIPCRVERRDDQNDLALLVVDAPISATPLLLAKSDLKPGTKVYTVGNPSGLEKTISDGLFTGVRDTGSRKLLQISAPISPGSSGSPILDAEGFVIGVAVLSLTEGQNLNFAVPAAAVRSLLTSSRQELLSPDALVSDILALQTRLNAETFSAEPSSSYQQLSGRISEEWEKAIAAAGDDEKTLGVIFKAAIDLDSDVTARVGLKLMSLSKSVSRTTRRETARALYMSALFASDELQTTKARQALSIALPLAKVPADSSPEELTVLAEIETLLNRHTEAEKHLKDALRKATDTQADRSSILWDLTENSFSLNDTTAARAYFGSFILEYSPTAWQYKSYADSLSKVDLYAEAAAAYLNAAERYPASAKQPRFEAICEAARLFWASDRLDEQLTEARRCLELGNAVTKADAILEVAHRGLADTLNKRGVYEEALAHAKNAIAIDANDGFAQYDAAVALHHLGRNQEALTAAKTGLRLTDGKWWSFHFLVGTINFDLENWEQARIAFEKSAEMNATDTAAPYNIALCLIHLQYYRDAATWFEEVLRRNPNDSRRADLLQRISSLRK